MDKDRINALMNKASAISSSTIYYRLIALWVICESALGGIIHGLRLPISGLLVGSCAVICITLIASYVPTKGSILKATIIVAIFKMMLSPQSPPTAYIAVFFQGIIGELLFFNTRWRKLACILFAILALLESAVQRILILIIVYGKEVWKAVNDFINSLTHQTAITNYSLYFVGVYILLHLLTGLFIGFFTTNLPSAILKCKAEVNFDVTINNDTILSNQIYSSKKKKILNGSLLIVWIVLIFLYIQSIIPIGEPLLSSHVSIQIFIRSLLIILFWYFVLSPLLNICLKKWLAKQQNKSQKDIQQILLLLPAVKYIVQQSWQLSSSYKGIKRWKQFCKISLVYTLYYE